MVDPPLSSVFRRLLIWLMAIGLWPLSAAAGEPVPALELLERARPVCQERQVHFPPGTDHSALPMHAPALINVTVYPIGFSAKGRLASLRFAWGDAVDSDRGNWDIVVQDLIDDKLVEQHRGTTEDSGHGLREAVGSQVADVVALLTKHGIAYPVIDGGMPPLFYGGDVLRVEVSPKMSGEQRPDWVIQLRSAQYGSKRIAEHFLPAVAESILLNPQEPRAAVVIRTVGNDHGVPVVNCFFIGAHLTSGFSKK
jgi:hypothetical protein